MNKNSTHRYTGRSANWDSGTVISCLTVGQQIDHHFDACELLPYHHVPERVAVKRIEGNHVQALVVGDKNGPLVVKLLGDDSKRALPEHIAASQNAVECAVAGIVYNNVFGGHPARYEVLHHHRRFVIVLRIVSAYNDVVDLTSHIQCHSGLYSVLVVGIDDVLTAVLVLCRTQQQAHSVLWNGIDVGVYLRPCVVYHLAIDHDHRRR